MQPIPVEVANRLESTYRELQPWTETWADELRCAVNVGPLGEEKVSCPLWPQLPPISQEPGLEDPPSITDPSCAARCFNSELSAEGRLNKVGDEMNKQVATPATPPFANYHIIFKDSRLAFLLKPSLKPSAYYGRRPVAKIMRGSTVGIPVIRGFGTPGSKHEVTLNNPGRGESSITMGLGGLEHSFACVDDRKPGQVKDLVLVIHGIGQKFAERVESFHFTHAINAFRRAVNLELESPTVKTALREEGTGIMVLPINWRQDLSFEDGGPMTEADRMAKAREAFGLKDIEPATIPAVRGLISDIMFDIPFYMSQHKSKMINALVAEANRVYRLWCQNNPGFVEYGRVHLIAHSLGSAMALDILSHQPTSISKLNPENYNLPATFFEFDTTNLFLVGSPAAFFLLLERGALIPRRGRLKADADPADAMAKDITGEAGILGCLAIDNVYNILAKEDPIAYLLNGTIDPSYAANLSVAYAPSTASSFVQTMGNAMRKFLPFDGPKKEAPPDSQAKPAVPRLPSQLELEVHDFPREDIAERKAYLLNDNGQIDYYLHSGGGPLEIQYLNMLGAHSSYWLHKDFIRLICVEIGRQPGRKHTIPEMRVCKVSRRSIGK